MIPAAESGNDILLMKKKAILLAASGLMLTGVFGQNMGIAIRRAKELSNQNNVRQGIAPAAGFPAAPQSTAAAQTLARLRADLTNLQSAASATAEQKQQLSRDLAACALGTKPEASVLGKLAEALAAALPGKSLAPAETLRLAQDLVALLNGSSLASSQKQSLFDDLQATLQVGGSSRKEAVGVGNAVKTATGDPVR